MNRSWKLLAAVPLIALPLLMGGTAAAATPTTGTPTTDPQPPDPQELLQCLRDHGVDVPDPQPDGGPVVIDVDAGDTAKLDALKACGPDLPPPGRPGTARIGGDPAELKPFAQCMREHGLSDFPDPDKDGLVLQKDSDVHPGTAEFDAAQGACKDLLPAPRTGGAVAGDGPVLTGPDGATERGPVVVGVGGADAAGSAVKITEPGKAVSGGVMVRIHGGADEKQG